MEEFIPPARREPIVRAPRMPQIEELPPASEPAARACARREAGVPAAETRRRSLLEKLAAFGISRPETSAARASAARRSPRRAQLSGPRSGPADPAAPAAPSRRARSGAARPAGPGHCRALASEDDQLEIPAFLRRQPN